MKNKAICAVNTYEMFSREKRVTVALSGGADSVALLHFLCSVAKEMGLEITAAHLNHGIRGEEADSDMEFCRGLCQKLNVPFCCEKVSIPKLSRETGESIELCARRVRYDFLYRVSPGIVATAHTASDTAETLLFNMSRGSGIKGLAGIPPKRDRIVRPLILATRQDVEEYCKENSLDYVTDSTNLSDEYTRNYIRINVIPLLTRVNSSSVENIVRTAGLLRDDSDYLENESQRLYKDFVCDNKLSLESVDLHKAMMSRIVGMFLKEQTLVSHEQLHIDAVMEIMKSGKGTVSLKKGFEAGVSRGAVRVFKRETEMLPTLDAKTGDNKIGEYTIEILPFNPSECNVNKKLLNGSIDCDKIVGKLVFRSRLEGETFRPVGRGVTKSLKNIFSELDIPFDKRGRVPMLADEEGIVWIPGMPVAQRVSVTKETKKAINIKLI